MKNSHFHFFLVILIIGFGLLGYTSYRTIDFTFTEHTALAEDVYVPEITTTPPDTASTTVPEAVIPTTTDIPQPTVPATDLSPEKKALIAELEGDLIKNDVRMKIGSKGTRVGTVQKFINIYEGKKTTIDNKYGAGLQKSILAFQKAVGDDADGLADPGTYQKMIDWLKAN